MQKYIHYYEKNKTLANVFEQSHDKVEMNVGKTLSPFWNI